GTATLLPTAATRPSRITTVPEGITGPVPGSMRALVIAQVAGRTGGRCATTGWPRQATIAATPVRRTERCIAFTPDEWRGRTPATIYARSGRVVGRAIFRAHHIKEPT